jgi:nucleotide-binding universal stress UspA family protein
MGSDSRILVAVNDTDSAARAVAYVGRMLGSSDAHRVLLLHVLPPVPVSLLEHGGSEDPDMETALEEKMEALRRRWVAEASENVAPLLEAMRDTLIDAGVAPGRIAIEAHESHTIGSVSEGILDAVKKHEVDTVVVGRESLTWFRDLVHTHVGHAVVTHAPPGVTVWIVQ